MRVRDLEGANKIIGNAERNMICHKGYVHDCCGEIDNKLLEIPQFFESAGGQMQFAQWKRVQAENDAEEVQTIKE